MSRTLRIALLALAMIVVILGMIAMYARDLRNGTEITLKTEPVDPRSLFLGHYAILSYAINRLDEQVLGDHCYKPNEAIFVTLEPDANGDWQAVRSAPQMPADAFGDARVTLRGRVQWGSACPADSAETTSDESPADAIKTEAPPLEPTTPAEEVSDAEPAEAPVDETSEIPADPAVEDTASDLTTFVAANVDYGIGQYFASPDAARRLDELARRRPTGEDGEPPPEPLEIILSVPRSGRALIKGVIIDGEKTYDQTLW